MERQKLLDRVVNCPRLPSLPSIAIEVIEMCRVQDINIKHIATTVSKDPALSSKVLKTVNSSFYGLSQSVSTISHALVILGLNSVKTLALGFSLIDTFKSQADQQFDMMKFWQRCVYSAVGARSVAQSANIVQLEEAFLAGLLQDIGMMGLIQTLGDSYLDAIEEAGPQHHKVRFLERQSINIDHAEVGAALGEKWKLPPILLCPIRFHEQPDKSPSDVLPIVRAVALGARAADVFLGNDPVNLDRYNKALHDWFGIDNVTGEQLLADIGRSTREMADLFDLDTAEMRDSQEILAEANETLLQLSLQSQQNASELETRNRQLQEQMTKDVLTGAANRGRFDEFLEEQFRESAQDGQPLGVIFVDADRFKSVNDTHGHQAGDAVLVSLANALMENAPAQSLVARYGGEEFAIILPDHDRKQTARIAETMRTKVQDTQIDCGEGITLGVTISLGVASMEGQAIFAQAKQLIEAADRAVYAAKHSGRNCVRVFVPKTPQPAAI